jgi:16S rRNA (uracil1498-N3)-methyltransferase
MSERFYVNCTLEPGPVLIQGAEAHHLATVCRFRPGDMLCLFNGGGSEFTARVLSVERRQVSLEILEQHAPRRELAFAVEVAAPLPKGDRAQFLIEKLTELGVSTFVPLSTERTIVQPRDTKLGKLERYVIEASKQCGRNRLMTVHPVQAWHSYLQRADLPARRFLAHPGGNASAKEVRAMATSPADCTIAIGPEGGFSPEEVALASAGGWMVVDLGARILRVETAAIALAALVSLA